MYTNCIICDPYSSQTSDICNRCISLHDSTNRDEFFKLFLNSFATKARIDFRLLEETCKNVDKFIFKREFDFTSITTFKENDQQQLVDPVAQDYIKSYRRFDDFVPITNQYDGNSLYHSIKQIIPNMTATLTELRARVMMAIMNTHRAYAERYPNIVKICDEFKQYCREVKDNQSSQIWDIFGLCEILNCRIHLILVRDPPIYRLYSGMYSPINNSQNATNTIAVMWIYTPSKTELQDRCTNLQINRFLPLLKRADIKASAGSMFLNFSLLGFLVNL